MSTTRKKSSLERKGTKIEPVARWGGVGVGGGGGGGVRRCAKLGGTARRGREQCQHRLEKRTIEGNDGVGLTVAVVRKEGNGDEKKQGTRNRCVGEQDGVGWEKRGTLEDQKCQGGKQQSKVVFQKKKNFTTNGGVLTPGEFAIKNGHGKGEKRSGKYKIEQTIPKSAWML